MRVVDFSDARTRRSFHVVAGIYRPRTRYLPRLEAKGPRAGDAPAVSPPALPQPGYRAAGVPPTSPSTATIYRDAKEAYSEVVQVVARRLLIIESIKGVGGGHRPLHLEAHDLIP